MKFEEKVSKLINKAEVPDCLSPENIALMLKEKSAEKNRKLEKNTPVISIKMKKRAIIYRTTAAAAACVALVFGAVALFSHNSTSLPTGYIESLGEVKVPSNYSDVFKVFQNSFTKNGKVIEKDDKKPTVNDFSGTQEIGKDDKPSDKPTAAQKEIAAGIQFSLSNEEVEGVSEADIVKSDGSNLYYVANENSLYILAMTNGKMSLVSKTSNENNNPVEMYIDGNRLAVVSNNVVEVPYKLAEKPAETSVSEAVTTSDKAVDTAQTSAEVSTETQVTTNSTTQVSTPVTSGNDKTTVPTTISQSNVVVEFYDISDKTAPKLLTTYKQNGAYVSSRMIGSKIYLVTNYAQYQTKPLEREADLDNYVPAYYINDAKTYIEAKDMCIPTNITGMGYTVVSGLDTQAAAPLTSIKAVLADGSETYFSQNSLYVVGQTKGSKNKDASVITQFKLADGNVSYSANASVDGTLVNSQSMSEINGSCRI
ncbi:MAG: beta-propeller domain-containing protein, partial [Oscillospiraceae bacterium]